MQSAGLIYQGDVYGVRGVLNVWEPKVNKYSKDSSAMCVEMKSGGEQHTDRIGAGVRVFPTLSGDTFVRFHISWVMLNFIQVHAIMLYIFMIIN